MDKDNLLNEVIKIINEKELKEKEYSEYIRQLDDILTKKVNKLNLKDELFKLNYLDAKKRLDKLFFVIDYEEFKELNDMLKAKKIEEHNKHEKLYYKSVVEKMSFLNQTNKNKLINFLSKEKQFTGYDVFRLLDSNNYNESDKKEDVIQCLLKSNLIKKVYKFRCKNKHNNCDSKQLSQEQFKELVSYNSHRLREISKGKNLNLKYNLYCCSCDCTTKIENLGMLYRLIKFEYFIVKNKKELLL